MILTAVVCLILAGSLAFILAGAFRLDRETRALDEQFAQEQEKTRETIDKLKEQEAVLETEAADIQESGNPSEENETEFSQENPDVQTVEKADSSEPLLVSILDCLQGEALKESSLYMDNPGIYFIARQIIEGDEIYQRAESKIRPDISGISLTDLRYLKMPYYNKNGEIRVGEMIVKTSISQEVLDGCLELFRQKHQIVSMNLDDHIWIEDDDAESIISRLKEEQ